MLEELENILYRARIAKAQYIKDTDVIDVDPDILRYFNELIEELHNIAEKAKQG